MIKKSILLAVLVGVITVAFAQKTTFSSYDLFKIKQVYENSMSPNGKYIAYVVNIPRPFSDEPGGDYKELHIYTVSTGISRLFIGGKKSFSSLGWTPNSREITFLAKFDDEKRKQVYAINVNGGAPYPVTKIATTIYSYSWNPQNNTIAYISVEKDDSRSALIKKGFNAEVFEETDHSRNLYIYDIDKSSSEQITKEISVFSMSWNPQGTMLAAQISKKNETDHSYMFKDMYTIDPASKEVKLLVDNPGKLTSMAWSPDGKNIAIVCAIDINDPVSGSLFILPVPNSKKFTELKNYTSNVPFSVRSVKWRDNGTVVYNADESVSTVLYAQKITGGEKQVLLSGGKVIFYSFKITKGKVVFSGSTPLHASELFTFDLKRKSLKRWTNSNEWMDDKKFGKQEKISYQSRDGLTMEGILIYPVDYEEGKQYPLITYVHGGPESHVRNGWSTYYSMWGQVAAGKEYFVFMPNYRGSSGRGVAFSKMDQGDMGDEEFNDVLDGIDYLINRGMVDKSKVGIGGGSYGGYFASWGATKHSERFAAAVSFVGITDHLSKRYTTDIPYESYYVHWKVWVHEDYDLALDRSPIKYITKSITPTLILHGKNDPRVHPSQSLMLYRGLKLHGKAPVRLIWYPGEGHGNRKNPARLDYSLRTMAWFDYYLKSDQPKDKMPAGDIEFKLD